MNARIRDFGRGAAALALAFLFAHGAAGSARAGMVRFTHGSTHVIGYLALPKGRDPPRDRRDPRMVGLNDWVKQQADSLRQGIHRARGDLYHGKVAFDQETAHQLMSGSRRTRLWPRSAPPRLASRTRRRARQALGVIGWCMGAGTPSGSPRRIRNQGVRDVLRRAHHGRGGDPRHPGLRAGELRRRGQGPGAGSGQGVPGGVAQGRKKVDMKIYPGAGHAFANINNPWGGYGKTPRRTPGPERWHS